MDHKRMIRETIELVREENNENNSLERKLLEMRQKEYDSFYDFMRELVAVLINFGIDFAKEEYSRK